MRREFLRSMLAQESRAYGFTLAFWGSGALLIDMFGMPSLEQIFLYTGGAVVGFGILAIIAFRQAFSNVDYDEQKYLVFSMVHFISALAPILLVSYIVQLKASYAFFLSGLTVSVIYNTLMIVEERLSRQAMMLERKLIKL